MSMVTQSRIARRVRLDVSTVNKILNKRPHLAFRKETIRKVFRAAKDLGYDLGKLKFQHRRVHPRKSAEVPLELSIYLADGTLFDRGQAIMGDVSLSGALLSGVILTEKKGIPLQPHTLGIRLLDGPLKDLEIRGRPVRFLQRSGTIHLAVEFERVEHVALKNLRKIVG
jgi:transcriptional regulator with XRE-family HTH domain